ncbi:MAG: hypothetical protein GY756_04055 [bacterium]|nr:hypothetical protein [bacterium]
MRKSITKEEAKKIAIEHIKDDEHYTSVDSVYDYDEISLRNTFLLFVRNIKNYWIAHISKETFYLESSTIALISKKTGFIDYFGEAGNEG